ncbi:unnamed protein product [Vitrella brassicaformis CCMP3155]|uniref:Ciliary BBSome complex subunit 2 C-terminal domain-containing protein n=1 Tax=Vitrella brassicaformis (strain CCMP3155) TaxID=1169540 RepID=A0A0G4GGA2_VITBC|nr:unnamed protein product [Vitrella brassicaformis CCMP3155]|eukprot:CEM28645.1 unnamed protein product [Vitrella brassicaformis CCMP3155]
MAYDYRGDGHMNLIAVNTNGDVRGWVAAPDTDRLQKELQRAPQKRRSRLGRGGGEVDTYATAAEANEAYRSLLREKQTLLKELTSYEANMKALTTTSHEASPSSAGVIPPDTQLTWTLLPNAAEGAVELTLQLSNHCVIRAVVLLGEGLFEGDCCTLHPMPPANNVTVRIAPARNVSTSLSVRAFVGLSASSTQYHLFELEVAFPKFAMYAAVTPDTETFNQYTAMKEESYVVFDAPEEAAKFVGWFEHAFALSPDDRTRVRQALRACKQPGGCAEVVFTSLRPAKDTNDQPGDCLGISLSAPDAAAAAGGGSGLPRVRVVCGDMEALSDVIAHMAEYFKIDQLDTIAHVPQELDRLGGVLGRVEGLQAARAKMTAEMADNSQLVSVCVVVGCQVSVCHQVKSLVLKAEEARILNRMSVAKQLFTQLQQLNQEMVGEYVKRCGNYDALMAELKDLNTSIQRAANLRVGASRTRVVSACRQALKAQNMPELFKVISTGHPSASGAATQNV